MGKSDILTELNFDTKEKLIHHLYQEYFGLVRKYIISNGGTSDDAKDIFQETIIAFITGINERSIKNLKALVMTIAKNKWIDQKRKERRFIFVDNAKDEYNMDRIVSETTPFDSMHLKEKEKAIETMFSSLGDRCKELLVNYVFYEMSMKEIADKMSFSSVDSAKTQHYKCRQKLIAQFKDNEQLKMILK